MNEDLKGTTVGVLFSDSDVASIFAELLEAQGVKAALLTKPDQFELQTHIITEPRFMFALNPAQYKNCLMVGDRQSLKDIPTLHLSQPLTEEKVEKALSSLFPTGR